MLSFFAWLTKIDRYFTSTTLFMKRFVHVFMMVCCLVPCSPAADGDWPVYLGDKASSQYSELKEIDRGNVGKLEVAWVFRAGDARENRSQIQCNPLVIDGVLYGTSPQLKLFALDAASGKELWRFDPFAGDEKAASVGVNRGVVYWQSGKDRRVLYTAGQNLYARPACPSWHQGRSGSSHTNSARAGLRPKSRMRPSLSGKRPVRAVHPRPCPSNNSRRRYISKHPAATSRIQVRPVRGLS